jgi:hypothetical protein
MPIALLIILIGLAGALAASGAGGKLGEKIAERGIRRRQEEEEHKEEAHRQGRTEHERLAQLTPDTQVFARRLLGELAARGLKVLLGETYRSPERQRELFEQGTRTAVKEPGWHHFGRAFHVLIYDPKTGELDVKARRSDLYGVMHQIARDLGGNVYGYKLLRNAKTGATFTDPAHIEYRAGTTLASLRRQAGYA